MNVEAIDSDYDFGGGHLASSIQDGVSIGPDGVSGTLLYYDMEDIFASDAYVPGWQLPLHVTALGEGAEDCDITVTSSNGAPAIRVPETDIWLCNVTDKDSQTITVVASTDDDSDSVTLDLSSLVLEEPSPLDLGGGGGGGSNEGTPT